ncbi:RNA polymerase recycling motor HelD [Enterococcus timonensis]|uniref:RNA polymerase recycling motor HelD n=1 Tax=Enterococcus timonensis TaxID=1852364 RepID=UPI0008D9973F|nr:RNA polymerase recycling motor HelD [Enterococcus timonensis]
MKQRQLEEQQLEQTLALITREEVLLQKLKEEEQNLFRQASLENGDSEHKVNAFSQESLWESYFARRQHENELLVRYHTVEEQARRQKTLALMEKNPYFARIDFSEDDELTKLYIGIASLRDAADQALVVDWRSPIANLYYESEPGKTYYEAVDGKIFVDLLLKRQFKIVAGKIVSMVDTTEAINDDFLLEILDENSNNHMKNIVATIQKAQNAIIRNTASQVMMIEGIAGSGKTSALLQRVAYLLYTHRKWLKTDQVLLFSPNHLFSEYIADVLPSLGESEIPTETFISYFQRLIPQFSITKESAAEQTFLSGQKSAVTQLKASLDLVDILNDYIAKITPVGPLFIDLKIKGEVVLAKEKIRGYYQETNPLLPLYQRISLLQTKLQKKLGGLMKDAQKKTWVKELVEHELNELFSKDLSLDDDPATLNKLQKQTAQKIVKKYFKKTKRQIDEFSFIAFNRQYLHFLSDLPAEFLQRYNLTRDQWTAEHQAVKDNFRNHQLLLADAPLFILLRRRLAPFFAGQQARFLFIDEMQDVTPLEAEVLKELHENGNFTFCGDLNQQIFGNPTLVNSIEDIFPSKFLQHYQLTTSYRSTAEITAFAESFLLETKNTNAPRHGEKPAVYLGESTSDLNEKLLAFINEPYSPQIKRRAILTKTTEEAEALYADLAPEIEQLQLITQEDDFFKKNLVIMPAFLAKGLEFDAVICYGINEENFANPADRLILYTMITRGMHQVSLFVKGTQLPFSHQQEHLYEKK